MNKITLILALMLIASLGLAQTLPYGVVSVETPRTLSAGTSMSAKAYTSSTQDTTQAINAQNWGGVTLLLKVLDSASVGIYFQPSFDGTSWAPMIFIDSLSNATDAGNFKAFTLPAGSESFPAVRFIVKEQGTFRLGTTSATYSVKIVKKRL